MSCTIGNVTNDWKFLRKSYLWAHNARGITGNELKRLGKRLDRRNLGETSEITLKMTALEGECDHRIPPH